MALVDRYNRVMRTVRISITDRCNLKCVYCMPNRDIRCLPRDDIMSFEEIITLVNIFHELGIEKVRLTGGEPLIRRDIVTLVEKLRLQAPALNLGLTTNGILLEKYAYSLKKAGLQRVNVSLDSLSPRTFNRITQGGDLIKVLRGIYRAIEAGLVPLKLNVVLIKGINDGEIIDMVNFARENNLIVRFIEKMPFADKTSSGVSNKCVKKVLHDYLEFDIPLFTDTPLSNNSENYPIKGGKGVVGFISPLSKPFCTRCDRLRMTSTGTLLTCIAKKRGKALLPLLRRGAPPHILKSLIQEEVAHKEPTHNGFSEQIQMNRVGG